MPNVVPPFLTPGATTPPPIVAPPGASLLTVKIESKARPDLGFVTINARDFNPDKHALWKEQTPEAQAALDEADAEAERVAAAEAERTADDEGRTEETGPGNHLGGYDPANATTPRRRGRSSG